GGGERGEAGGKGNAGSLAQGEGCSRRNDGRRFRTQFRDRFARRWGQARSLADPVERHFAGDAGEGILRGDVRGREQEGRKERPSPGSGGRKSFRNDLSARS